MWWVIGWAVVVVLLMAILWAAIAVVANLRDLMRSFVRHHEIQQTNLSKATEADRLLGEFLEDVRAGRIETLRRDDFVMTRKHRKRIDSAAETQLWEDRLGGDD